MQVPALPDVQTAPVGRILGNEKSVTTADKAIPAGWIFRADDKTVPERWICLTEQLTTTEDEDVGY